MMEPELLIEQCPKYKRVWLRRFYLRGVSPDPIVLNPTHLVEAGANTDLNLFLI